MDLLCQSLGGGHVGVLISRRGRRERIACPIQCTVSPFPCHMPPDQVHPLTGQRMLLLLLLILCFRWEM